MQTHALYEIIQSLVQWNLSDTDPMGPALVHIIYSGTAVIQTLYGINTGLYNIQWNLSYIDPMGLH